MSNTTATELKERGTLTLRTLAMPADANPSGDIFGGWVMSQMDIASGIAAMERAGGRVVTAAVDSMSFIQPVNVGDILCIYCAVNKVGRTSINIHVDAWVQRNHQTERLQVTQGTFIFVSLDENGKPKPVPVQG